VTEGVRILISDDHPVVRAGLEGMLSKQPDLEVVGEASNGREAVELVDRLRPDVVLMDLRMPQMDGVAAIAEIKEENPETHVLVLTTYDSDADILRAIEAGATGYLLKDAPREELYEAVRAVARGRPLLAGVVADRLMRRIREPRQESLSGREIEVLELVRRGQSNREIARELHVSEATVKTHLIHIFSKLNVADRTAAVNVALERGILRLEK
jgi:DNA-binding NarL/FixJ family response regulator